MGNLRIIGGKFRSRKISFPDGSDVAEIEGLRPTPNRLRETLFNWLSPIIHDSRCLDLFAGSGALSFEAISRGAKEVIAVDQSLEVISHLKRNARLLECDNISIFQKQIPTPLPIEENSIDILFLDPPFHQNLIKVASQWIEKINWLKPNATIYIEAEKDLKLETTSIPENWTVVRSKKAGQIAYYLLERTMNALV